MPFVVGAPRSGTTLLRLMLDAHPEIAIPAESHFYPAVLAVDPARTDWLEAVLSALTRSHTWGDYHLDAAQFEAAARALHPLGPGDVLRAFYRAYAARFGKPAWGDKWPGNVLRMREITRLLPEARFIHVIRDGRDVAVSLRERWFRPGDSYEACIELWAGRIRAGREQAPHVAYHELRYEALVHDPKAALADVCAFIDLRYDDAMLGYPERARARHAEIGDWQFQGRTIPRGELVDAFANTQQPPSAERIGRWRDVMTAADVARCERSAGELLAELGYR